LDVLVSNPPQSMFVEVDQGGTEFYFHLNPLQPTRIEIATCASRQALRMKYFMSLNMARSIKHEIFRVIFLENKEKFEYFLRLQISRVLKLF